MKMEADSEINDNACRLCDKNDGPMRSVFEKNEGGQQILHLIKDLLPIPIYRTDPLPKNVCDSCLTNLNSFYELRKNALETFKSHKDRLRSSYDENNVSIRLYLDTVENENFEISDIQPYSVQNSTAYEVEETNNSNYESELCAELQQAIRESLKQNKLKEKLIQQKELLMDFINAESDSKTSRQNSASLNGTTDIPDEDSQQSFTNKDIRNSDSPDAISQSDMELCDSDIEAGPKIMTTNISGKRYGEKLASPAPKKRRLIGPKAYMERLQKRYEDVLRIEFNKKEVVTYNPLSLLQYVLNTFNKIHVPEYVCENYKKCVALVDVDNSLENMDSLSLRHYNDLLPPYPENSDCNYCDTPFPNVNLLAEHESRHILVDLGEKVDDPELWPNAKEDALVRNYWLKTLTDGNDLFGLKYSSNLFVKEEYSNMSLLSHEPVEEIEFDQSLLVPVNDSANDGNKLQGEVVLIDTKATVNGVLLSELPKDERRTLYKSVIVNGIKRKFCPLCRYTFKDNWAIESHYFSTACHYTCRFCGVRFNKQRHEFDPHVKQHILNGDIHTNKVFSSRKFKVVPNVINEKKMKIAGPPHLTRNAIPRVQPLKMKTLFERNVMQTRYKFKTEATENGGTPMEGKTDAKPQNQAYFCRKCYQVFFKLDEFNVHVVNCNGTGANIVKTHIRTYNKSANRFSPNSYSKPQMKQRPASSSGSANSDNETSPSGRPVRHCVKEAGPYVDGEEPDDSEEPRRVSNIPSARGFECNMCSSCFPTVHSRNSHMRIHKAAFQLNSLNSKSISIMKNRPNNVAKKVVDTVDRQGIPTFTKYVNEAKIKQEPMEPIVEIHEHSDFSSIPSSIGSVSITPIPNAQQKTNLDPNIIKLVQNNPNLTIKSMANSGTSAHTASNNAEVDASRFYRCSSCAKPFANKSDLYFHKKNQCSGSRFPCPFCKKRFGSEAAYSSHIFYNHPE